MVMNITYNFDTFDDGKQFRLQQAALSQKASLASSESVKETANATPKDDKDWSFWDFIDFINPLQHIPVVNTIYREITGDTIKAPARILGGALFGGVAGAAASVVNAVMEETSGKDMGGHMVAMMRGDDAETSATEVASLSSEQTMPAVKVGDVERQVLAEAKNPVVEIRGKNFVDGYSNLILATHNNDDITQWNATNALNKYGRASSLAEQF